MASMDKWVARQRELKGLPKEGLQKRTNEQGITELDSDSDYELESSDYDSVYDSE